MGYLTTFTIYNDGIDQITQDCDEFCRKLRQGPYLRGTNTFGHGNHCSLVKVQKSRHADDHTVYVHMGNTVCEMNAHSSETEELLKNSPEFFDEMLTYMKRQVEALERLKKESA